MASVHALNATSSTSHSASLSHLYFLEFGASAGVLNVSAHFNEEGFTSTLTQTDSLRDLKVFFLSRLVPVSVYVHICSQV